MYIDTGCCCMEPGSLINGKFLLGWLLRLAAQPAYFMLEILAFLLEILGFVFEILGGLVYRLFNTTGFLLDLLLKLSKLLNRHISRNV